LLTGRWPRWRTVSG